MCRKLGKGHLEYFDRNEAKFTVDDNGVKHMRRTYAGRPIDKHHGTNVLNAYTDLRDKYWSWFPDQSYIGQTTTAAKAKKLAQLQKHTDHGMTRYGRARRLHLERNHVFVNRERPNHA